MRKSHLRCPPMAMLFSTVASRVASPGPRSTDRGELPNVKFAGLTNAVVLNQWLSVRFFSGRSGFATRFGRSGPAGKALVVFADVITVNGAPDIKVSSALNRHPPIT